MNTKNNNQEYDPRFKTEAEIKVEALKKQEEERKREASTPKSGWQRKWENYWYHYKTMTICLTFCAIVLGFLIMDLVTAVKPDITIVIVTSQQIPHEYLDEMARALEDVAPDINKDGKISVSLDHIPYTPADPNIDPHNPPDMTVEEALSMSGNMENEYNYTMKLLGIIAAASDPIYILDEPNYENLLRMSGESSPDYDVFIQMDDITGSQGSALPLSETVLDMGSISPYLNELAFYYRNISGSEKEAVYFEACYTFLQSIAK